MCLPPTSAFGSAFKMITISEPIHRARRAAALVLCLLIGGECGAYPPSSLAFLLLLKEDAVVRGVLAGGSHTTEAGGEVTFKVSLSAAPLFDVVVPLFVTNTDEGHVDVSSLVFSRTTWSLEQNVKVTGVNDLAADGNQSFSIRFSPAESVDPIFNGFHPADIRLTNDDNDLAGFIVTPGSGLQTAELGGQASFLVRLKSLPASSVIIPVIASSDPTEGTVAPGSLTFTTANWFVNQVVTITGVNDAIVDGSIGYTILLGSAGSADPGYNGLDPPDVSVVNVDNDAPGITISPVSGLVTTEGGGTAVFSINLNTPPCCGATVVVSAASSNPLEGTASPAVATLSAITMSVNVTITGVNDTSKDGDKAYVITLGTSTSGDPVYNGIASPNVSITNLDDEKFTFTTAFSFQGNIGGISGADSKCMLDFNRPSSAVYKAVLSDGAARVACTSPGCSGGVAEHSDWVFSSGTNYFRQDGLTLVMTTTPAGVFTFGTLLNSFAAGGAYWTGLAPDWTSAAGNCSAWSATAGAGRVGSLSGLNAQAISNGATNCNSAPGPLLCAEQ